LGMSLKFGNNVRNRLNDTLVELDLAKPKFETLGCVEDVYGVKPLNCCIDSVFEENFADCRFCPYSFTHQSVKQEFTELPSFVVLVRVVYNLGCLPDLRNRVGVVDGLAF